MFPKIWGANNDDLIDCMMSHYAYNEDYKEATLKQKFFSLIAIQIIMRNKTTSLHYDWFVSVLYGLITTQTQVSV